MPQRLSKHFTGRAALLDQIAVRLRSRRRGPAVVALHGLDGVGKTQIALAYAYRDEHGDRYQTVRWVSAGSSDLLKDGCAEIAEKLGLPTADRDPRDVVRAWFEAEAGQDWLLVFDDVPEPRMLSNSLPRTGNGSVLITSRYAAWRGTGEALGVEPFERNEAIDFLLRRTGQSDEQSAGAVVDELGALPLALEQAAVHVLDHGLGLRRYAELLRDDLEAALALGDRGAGPRTVAGVWSPSLRSLGEESPMAYDLLCLLSFLAPETLDQDCVEHAGALLGSTGDADNLAYDLIGALRCHSLVQSQPSGTVSVHRLVQAVVRARLSGEERRRWADAAVRLIAAVFPVQVERHDNWPACEQLVPHGLAATRRLLAMGVRSPVAADVLGRVGWYLWQRGRSAAAREHLEAAVQLADRADLDASTTAWLRNRLGLVLQRRRRLAQAAAVLEEALALNAGPGGDSGELRFGLATLALVYQVRPQPELAQRAFEQGADLVGADLDLVGAAPRGSSRSTVTSLLRDGLRQLEQGYARAAQESFSEARDIAERLWGGEHPEVALCLEQLGRALVMQDDPGHAYGFLLRAHAIDEARFGPSHPRVAADLDARGLALIRLDGSLAEELLERAIEINRERLGPDHPEVANNLVHLARVYGARADRAEARRLLGQALEIYRQSLGEAHAQTRRTKASLEAIEQL